MNLDITETLLKVLQEEEGKGAQAAFDSAVQKADDEKLAEEKNKLLQLQRHEQEIFVQEMEPFLNFIQKLGANGLLPHDYLNIQMAADKISVNTGLLFGFRGERNDYHSRSRYHHRSRKSNEDISRSRIDHIRRKAVLQRELITPKLEDKHEEYFIKLATNDDIDNLYDQTFGGYNEDVLIQAFFLGETFKRGQTSAEQVHQFVSILVRKLYDMDRDNSENQQILREAVKDCFGINVDTLHEISAMALIARNFKALGDEKIKLPEAAAPVNYAHISKISGADISKEIKAAIALSSDPLAILNIGADAVSAAQQVTLEIADTVLPMSLPQELGIIHTLKADIIDLSPKSSDPKKLSLGGAVLKRILGSNKEPAFAQSGDKSAALSANFSLLAVTLNNSREIMMRRISVLRQQSKMADALTIVLKEYNKRMQFEVPRDEANPFVNESYKQRQEMIVQNIEQMQDLKTELDGILKLEVKAYVAIMRASQAIPLVAVNLIKAVGHLRQQSSDLSTQGANDTLAMIQGNGDVPLSPQSDQKTWETLKGVFDGAIHTFSDLEAELGLSKDACAAASNKRRLVINRAVKSKVSLS